MHTINHIFSQKIIAWYFLNKRDLPWRNTKDPYRVWLSEIILQQTRVVQGMPYFLKFTNAYPTLKELAEADEQEILKLWQGLGYYSRARNMHATARFVYKELDAKFPITYKELVKLKGIGDYTASAIASFCYNEVQAVVDGNVYRVIARYFGIKTPINTSKAKKEFKEIAFELIDNQNPGLFNQAIMELGSLQCTPKSPNCEACPVQDSCVAFQRNQIADLPKKNSRLKIKKRFFNYLILENKQRQTVVNKRIGKGIWQNLYEFPVVETKENVILTELIKNSNFNDFVGNADFHLKQLNPKPIIHKLSHQHLHITFWLLKTDYKDKSVISWEEVLKLPFPIVIFNFIEEFLEKNE